MGSQRVGHDWSKLSMHAVFREGPWLEVWRTGSFSSSVASSSHGLDQPMSSPSWGSDSSLSLLIDVTVTLTSKVAAPGSENVQDFISFPLPFSQPWLKWETILPFMNWVLPVRLSVRCRGWMEHIPDGGKVWGRGNDPGSTSPPRVESWLLPLISFPLLGRYGSSPALSFLICDVGIITMIYTDGFVSGKGR